MFSENEQVSSNILSHEVDQLFDCRNVQSLGPPTVRMSGYSQMFSATKLTSSLIVGMSRALVPTVRMSGYPQMFSATKLTSSLTVGMSRALAPQQ
jgi:hypothetical protein